MKKPASQARVVNDGRQAAVDLIRWGPETYSVLLDEGGVNCKCSPQRRMQTRLFFHECGAYGWVATGVEVAVLVEASASASVTPSRNTVCTVALLVKPAPFTIYSPMLFVAASSPVHRLPFASNARLPRMAWTPSWCSPRASPMP